MPDPRIFPIVSANDISVGVPAADVIVLQTNPNRVDADFTNDSDDVIYLARGNAAVIGAGIRLNPNGGSYHIGTNNLFHGAIHAISTNAMQGESNLCISEGEVPK